MVWGVFSTEEFGPINRIKGEINANVYHKLLEQKVILSIPSIRESPIQPAIFMHDNAPCHRAKRVKQCLTEEKIEVINWPAQSLDLNPLKNLTVAYHRKTSSEEKRNNC